MKHKEHDSLLWKFRTNHKYKVIKVKYAQFGVEQPSQLQPIGHPPILVWPQGIHVSCEGASQLHDPDRWDFVHTVNLEPVNLLNLGIPEFDDPGRKWDAGTGTQVGPGNRDASGTREPGRRWDPGTGTQVGRGNRDAGGNREPGRRWDPKFFPIWNMSCFWLVKKWEVFLKKCFFLDNLVPVDNLCKSQLSNF